MPHFTPECSDKVVYTTVDEAHSGPADDMGAFLGKLKKDLCIGVDGYPKYRIAGNFRMVLIFVYFVCSIPYTKIKPTKI